jgi:hypothetical protein
LQGQRPTNKKLLEVLKMENKKYFFGNEISSYGVENNRVDYRTLAKSFDAVLCNDITKLFYSSVNGEFNEPELYSGSDYDDENENFIDIFQYYIISSGGADILKDYSNEIVYYLPALDLYVWAVTHYGTAWDYVLTDIKINDMED